MAKARQALPDTVQHGLHVGYLIWVFNLRFRVYVLATIAFILADKNCLVNTPPLAFDTRI